MALVDTTVTLDWFGEEVRKRTLNAARQAVGETTAACVPLAMEDIPVDTG